MLGAAAAPGTPIPTAAGSTSPGGTRAAEASPATEAPTMGELWTGAPASAGATATGAGGGGGGGTMDRVASSASLRSRAAPSWGTAPTTAATGGAPAAAASVAAAADAATAAAAADRAADAVAAADAAAAIADAPPCVACRAAASTDERVSREGPLSSVKKSTTYNSRSTDKNKSPQPWPVTGSKAPTRVSTAGSPPLASTAARPGRRRPPRPAAAPRSRRSRPSRQPRLPPAQLPPPPPLPPRRAATPPPVALHAAAPSHPAPPTMGANHPPAGSAWPARRRWPASRSGRGGRPDTRRSSAQSVRPGPPPPRTPWRVPRVEEDGGGGERAGLRSRPKALRPLELWPRWEGRADQPPPRPPPSSSSEEPWWLDE